MFGIDLEIFNALWGATQTYLFPFLSFATGVYISDVLGLNEGQARKQVYLMALPVGLLTVGILLTGTSVTVDGDVKHGHTQNLGVLMVFCGTIMFYGTLVPQLFKMNRKQMTSRLEENGTIETALGQPKPTTD
jgi:hypothetical protein